jgi:MFS family permease
MMMTASDDLTRSAFRFVLVLGIVNLLADATYEGARGISGPFLGSLGASAAVVGILAGLGELLGYCLRSVSGYLADKTHRYWILIFAGYAINILAVPALALGGAWPVAAGLLVAERTGRAIHRPSVEALIADAGNKIGHGWVFGFNEALDQTGATIGPLITTLVLYLHGGFHRAFAFLLIPALLCLGTLSAARFVHSGESEPAAPSPATPQSYPKAYWMYAAAGACFAASFADFSLIAFHFRKANVVSQALVPVVYSVAMASGAIASLVMGRLLDRRGATISVSAFLLSACAAPLVFLGYLTVVLAGAVLWGIGLGAQDSLLKALLSRVIPNRRSSAFGLFDTIFGVVLVRGKRDHGPAVFEVIDYPCRVFSGTPTCIAISLESNRR